MQVTPVSITIKKRIRKDLGDLKPLMESMKKYGQLSPIIINRKYELIAGHRRLESARLLGWHSINAVIVDRDNEQDKMEMELEENIQRRDLSPEELAEGFSRLEKLSKPSLFRRILNFIIRILKRIFRRK